MRNKNKIKTNTDIFFKSKKGFGFYDFIFGRISKDETEFTGQSLLKFFPIAITKKRDLMYFLEKGADEDDNDFPYFILSLKERGTSWVPIGDDFILTTPEDSEY